MCGLLVLRGAGGGDEVYRAISQEDLGAQGRAGAAGPAGVSGGGVVLTCTNIQT